MASLAAERWGGAGRLAPGAGWALLGAAAVAVAWYHLRLILYPFVYEPNEWTQVHSAWLLLQGRNPYAFSEQPAACNVYGWGVPALAWLGVKAGLPLGLPLLRGINGLGILGASAVVASAARRQGASWALALALALVFHASELYHVGAHARVDGVALFFLVFALWLPWRSGFSKRGIAGGLVAACLGAYVKPYLAALPAFVMLGAWQTRGWRACLATGIAGAVLLLASFRLVTWVFPAYGYLTLLLQTYIQREGSWLWDLVQWRMLVLRLYPALWLALGLALWRRRRHRAGWGLDPYWSGCLAAGMLLFGLYLGKGTGAFMTYAMHWVSPFLFLAVVPALRLWRPWQGLAVLGLNLILLGLCVPEPAVIHAAAMERAWGAEQSLLAGYSPLWAINDCDPLLSRLGRGIVDGGQTDAFPHLMDAPPGDLQRYPALGRLQGAWRDYLQRLQAGIERGDYQLLVIRPPFEPQAALKLHYRWLSRETIPGPSALGTFYEDLWLRRDLPPPRGGRPR